MLLNVRVAELVKSFVKQVAGVLTTFATSLHEILFERDYLEVELTSENTSKGTSVSCPNANALIGPSPDGLQLLDSVVEIGSGRLIQLREV